MGIKKIFRNWRIDTWSIIFWISNERPFICCQNKIIQICQHKKVIRFEFIKDKALAVKNGLTKWGNVNFHIVCHSTGCGLGTFLAKNNENNCKSLILISPWNKKDDDFRLLQKRRIENARTLDSISFLKSEYKLLYSTNYIEKFKKEFLN